MNPEMLEHNAAGSSIYAMELLSGLVFGAIFGFLLQRAHVLRFDKQLGMLRFKDMTVMKFMLSAALVGAIGMTALEQLYLVNWESRFVVLLPFILGGMLFGLGWAICGYCPGTLLGAMGEGRWDAGWVFLGGLAGSIFYANLVNPYIGDFLVSWGTYREGIDLDTALGVSPWLVIAGFAAICLSLFWWLEKRGV